MVSTSKSEDATAMEQVKQKNVSQQKKKKRKVLATEMQNTQTNDQPNYKAELKKKPTTQKQQWYRPARAKTSLQPSKINTCQPK